MRRRLAGRRRALSEGYVVVQTFKLVNKSAVLRHVVICLGVGATSDPRVVLGLSGPVHQRAAAVTGQGPDGRPDDGETGIDDTKDWFENRIDGSAPTCVRGVLQIPVGDCNDSQE